MVLMMNCFCQAFDRNAQCQEIRRRFFFLWKNIIQSIDDNQRCQTVEHTEIATEKECEDARDEEENICVFFSSFTIRFHYLT